MEELSRTLLGENKFRDPKIREWLLKHIARKQILKYLKVELYMILMLRYAIFLNYLKHNLNILNSSS